MNAPRTLLFAALLLPGLALAHHHHHHHHHSGSRGDVELVCVRWEADITPDAVGSADVDGGTCGCEGSGAGPETSVALDAGIDAGVALESEARVGEHCAEWAPAVGCSSGAGLMPFAGALLLLLGRRGRSPSPAP